MQSEVTTSDERHVYTAVEILRAKSVCLVLDGLEVLQERPGQTGYGALLEPDLRELLVGLCRRQDGLVVLDAWRTLVRGDEPCPHLDAGIAETQDVGELEPRTDTACAYDR